MDASTPAAGDRQASSPPDADGFRFSRALDLLRRQGVVPRPGLRWLDLGCNQGQFLRVLLSQAPVEAIGADDWDPALKGPADAGWTYHQCDLAQGLPACGPVDVVSALEVIEHMIDTDAFLLRVHDILRPGGAVLLSTPNLNSLRNRVTVPLGAYPAGPEHRNLIHHVRLYNAPTLRRHLTESGFRDVSLSGVGFLPMSSRFGRGRLSARLADGFPSLCSNLLAAARR